MTYQAIVSVLINLGSTLLWASIVFSLTMLLTQLKP